MGVVSIDAAIYGGCILTSIEKDLKILLNSLKHLARTIIRRLKYAAYPVASQGRCISTRLEEK